MKCLIENCDTQAKGTIILKDTNSNVVSCYHYCFKHLFIKRDGFKGLKFREVKVFLGKIIEGL